MSVGGLRQRQLWWYMLFFQHPQADACLQENDWTLARELFGQGEPAQVMDAYVQALSQPGAWGAGVCGVCGCVCVKGGGEGVPLWVATSMAGCWHGVSWWMEPGGAAGDGWFMCGGCNKQCCRQVCGGWGCRL